MDTDSLEATLTKVASPPFRVDPATRRVVPVKWWAGVGAIFVALNVYLYTRWLASGPAPTPLGPSTVPHWMKISINMQIGVGFIAAALIIYYFLVRPWRREGHLTLDGMFVIGFLSLYWQDSLMDALNPNALYNTYNFNWGSWDNYIPGWRYPDGGRVAEPFAFTGPLYVWALFGGIVVACLVMRRCQTRWPRLTNIKLALICFGFFICVDAIEIFWIRTGVYSFVGVATPSWLTLWDGHWYQFPLHEPFLWGLTWASWACLRYFKNDKGQTIAERGVETLNISPSRKRGLRLLAVIGVMNSLFFIYQIPALGLSLYIRAWPKDVINRSYFTNGLCGLGTSRACPNPAIPIPHGSLYTGGPSVYISPDGKVVVPPGTKQPE